MKRFRNILYFAHGNDPEPRALERAVALAGANRARLTVMDVIPEARLAASVEKELRVDLNGILRQRRQEELEALLAPHADTRITARCHVRQGTPFLEVIHAVLENGYDLVIKGARPAGGLRDKLLGSTDLHLLRKCPCPVWIEQPEAAYPYRTILAAVDPMEPNEAALNRMIMDLATSLAARETAELHVVHAWWLEWESTLRSGRGRIPTLELERLLAAEELEHRTRLDALLAPYGLSSADQRVRMVKARAAEAIAGLADALAVDVIVMGTVGRSGVPGLLIGNTAENVLQGTRTSVLTVKPPAFESPVRHPKGES